MQYIAFDAKKHYTLASVAGPDGRLVREERGRPHDAGFLPLPPVDRWATS